LCGKRAQSREQGINGVPVRLGGGEGAAAAAGFFRCLLIRSAHRIGWKKAEATFSSYSGDLVNGTNNFCMDVDFEF
jgi:hypothetical protein